LDLIPVSWVGVLECWSIGNNSFEMSKSPLGPSLQYSSTPIINNVLLTTDNPIDKQTQFIAVHSIVQKKAGPVSGHQPCLFKLLKNRITLEKRLFVQGHFFDSSPLFDHFRFFDLHRTCGQPCSSYPLLPFSQECGLCMNIAVDQHLNADLRCLSNPVPYENRSHPVSISLFIHSGRGGLLFIRVLDPSSGTILDCGLRILACPPRPETGTGSGGETY